jgi:hypothetical protein
MKIYHTLRRWRETRIPMNWAAIIHGPVLYGRTPTGKSETYSASVISASN